MRAARDRTVELIAALTLIAALAIYALFRDGLWLHRALGSIGLPSAVLAGRAPGWFVYVLPDALWQLAFCALIAARWWPRPASLERTSWLLAPLCLGLGIEVLSAFGVVEGVFDPLDVAAMGLGGLTGYALAWWHARDTERPRWTSVGVVMAFSLMLAATSRSSTSSGPVPVGIGGGTPGGPVAVTGFQTPDWTAWPETTATAADLLLHLPSDVRLVASGVLTSAPIGPFVSLVLPSGYEVKIDATPGDLVESLRNARAHEQRGGVRVLLADPDAVVAEYGSGCRALVCKRVGPATLCGSIGKRAARDGGAEQHPTRNDCAVLVSIVRSMEIP